MTIKVQIKGKEIRMTRKEYRRRFGNKPVKTGYTDKEMRNGRR